MEYNEAKGRVGVPHDANKPSVSAWRAIGCCPLLVSTLLWALAACGLTWHAHAPTVAFGPSVQVFLLSLVGVIGGVLPVLILAIHLRRVIRDRTRFRLSILLQSYASLVLAFGTLYSVLQVSGEDPAFRGMRALTQATPDALSQLQSIIGDSVYLSVITVTTLGYGDLTPLTPSAKVLAALEGLSGIAFMGLALGHYFSVCTGCTPQTGAGGETHHCDTQEKPK